MTERILEIPEIKDRAETEGLGNAVHHFISHKRIADPKLAKLWRKAETLLNDIEEELNTDI